VIESDFGDIICSVAMEGWLGRWLGRGSRYWSSWERILYRGMAFKTLGEAYTPFLSDVCVVLMT